MAAAVVSAGALAVLGRLDPPAWRRRAGDGRSVSLSEGAVAGAGVLAGTLVGGVPGAAAAAGAGALAGAIDDLWEDRFPARAKGLRGHLGALAHGQLTSGALKIILVSAGAGVAAGTLPNRGSKPARALRWASRSALIAGTANLVNLFDLRPTRALKVVALGAAPLAVRGGASVRPVAAAILTTAAAAFPGDASGATMLGDAGANALGGALGYGLATRPGAVRWPALGTVVALTLASERVSFSRIIDSSPLLARIDRWGRSS